MGTLKKRFFTSADPVIRRSLGFCRWLLEIDCSDFELKRKQHQLFSFVLMSELVWTNSYLTQEFFLNQSLSFRTVPFQACASWEISQDNFPNAASKFKTSRSLFEQLRIKTKSSLQIIFSFQSTSFSLCNELAWFTLERQDLILSLVFRFRRDFRN